jgi:5-methyltetrahydrofolate--homocysteine methyltransferase
LKNDEVLEELKKAIIDCVRLEEAKELARKALDTGAKPLDIMDAVREALDEVGDLYEKKEYFLMELTLAGSTATEIMEMIRPELKKTAALTRGKVVIGTVYGDLHYIGKDIVIAMLASQGLDVIDLGVDVPCASFVEAVKNENPDVLAMSGLLTIVVDEMRKVIDTLKSEGLRDRLKIMIGGRAVNDAFAAEIGADAFGANAVDAVRLATEWIGAK